MIHLVTHTGFEDGKHVRGKPGFQRMRTKSAERDTEKTTHRTDQQECSIHAVIIYRFLRPTAKRSQRPVMATTFLTFCYHPAPESVEPENFNRSRTYGKGKERNSQPQHTDWPIFLTVPICDQAGPDTRQQRQTGYSCYASGSH